MTLSVPCTTDDEIKMHVEVMWAVGKDEAGMCLKPPNPQCVQFLLFISPSPFQYLCINLEGSMLNMMNVQKSKKVWDAHGCRVKDNYMVFLDQMQSWKA